MNIDSSDMTLPKVFVGSSSEALTSVPDLIDMLKTRLRDICEVTIWASAGKEGGSFLVGDNLITSLMKTAETYDFAIVILTPDYELANHPKPNWVSKDNVYWEAGLFTGRLGSERTLMIHCILDGREPKKPSNVGGVIHITYQQSTRVSTEEAVRSVCETIRNRLTRTPERGGWIRGQAAEIVKNFEEIGRNYNEEHPGHNLFERHRRKKIFDTVRWLRKAAGGELETAERTLLPDLIRLAEDTENPVLAVTHYAQTEWWSEHDGMQYLKAHEEIIARGIKVKRIFILPHQEDLLEEERPLARKRILKSIRLNWDIGVSVRVLPLEPGQESIGVWLDDHQHWIRRKQSFLVVPGKLVSDSLLYTPKLERPPVIYFDQAHIDYYTTLWYKLNEQCYNAEILFPELLQPPE